MKCKACGSENLIKDIDIYCSNCGEIYSIIDDPKTIEAVNKKVGEVNNG